MVNPMTQTTTTISREQLIKALLEEQLELLQDCSYEELVKQATDDGVFTLQEFIHNYTF
ncbi:hypothetical protein N9026_00175 [bacterium]|nr:hypothetical protein [bacterium]